MSKSKIYLLAEKIYGEDISDSHVSEVVGKVSLAAKILVTMNDGCMVCDMPNDEYVAILDSFDEEDKALAAMLMANLAGFSDGRS